MKIFSLICRRPWSFSSSVARILSADVWSSVNTAAQDPLQVGEIVCFWGSWPAWFSGDGLFDQSMWSQCLFFVCVSLSSLSPNQSQSELSLAIEDLFFSVQGDRQPFFLLIKNKTRRAHWFWGLLKRRRRRRRGSEDERRERDVIYLAHSTLRIKWS